MIFIFLYILIFVFGVISIVNNSRKVRLLYCIVISLVLSLLMGLRRIDYAGVDTIVYANDFNRILYQNYTLADVFAYFDKDYLFYVIARLFSYVLPDVNLWILACSLFYISAISWFIYKYSTNVFLSYIIFTSWQFYLYDFQLMRHVFSLTFIILSIKYVFKRDIKYYSLLLLGAVGTQIVSIVAVPLYWMFNISRRHLFVLLTVATLFFMFVYFFSRDELISLIFRFGFLQSDRFVSFRNADGGSMQNFIINLLFVSLSLFVYYRNRTSSKFLEIQKEMITFLIMSIVGLVFYSMQFIVGEFYRVAQYYSFVIIVMVPTILSLERNRILRISLILGITFFCVRHFFGGFWGSPDYFPYKFFFELTSS